MKKYALITGGSSGIGLELARLFAKDKFNLVLVARDLNKLQQAAAELSGEGIEVITLPYDLFDTANAGKVFEEVKSRNLTVEVLVNNAGQGVYGKFEETDLQRELAIVQLNICSLIVLTKLFLQDMKLRGSGKILNLSSIAGKVPGPYQAVYHGTKAFVHSFTEAVRNEVRDSGITLTSLLPGATDTDFFNKAGMTEAKIVREGKLGDPASVAKDGYEALMAGKDMVISGWENKMQVAVSNILPDSVAANNMRKQQEPEDDR